MGTHLRNSICGVISFLALLLSKKLLCSWHGGLSLFGQLSLQQASSFTAGALCMFLDDFHSFVMVFNAWPWT
jgi:hypothetical protein